LARESPESAWDFFILNGEQVEKIQTIGESCWGFVRAQEPYPEIFLTYRYFPYFCPEIFTLQRFQPKTLIFS
jgi:hypothetical protein